MKKLYSVFFLFLVGVLKSLAQTVPDENSILNYRLIGFVVSPEWVGSNTVVQVARGRFTEEGEFLQNLVRTKKIAGERSLIEVPYFGIPYTWRIVKTTNGKPTKKSDFRHFRVGISLNADTAHTRMRITAPAHGQTEFYVFSDGTRSLFDNNGHAVWYMPVIPGVISENSMIRDLKTTSLGTITFIQNNNIFEMSWDGEILWRGPNNGDKGKDDIGIYHHEFTRLPNGHYMVLTDETICVDSQQLFKIKDGNLQRNDNIIPGGFAAHDTKMPGDKCNLYPSVVEYNEQGDIVWIWRSQPFFQAASAHQRGSTLFAKDAHANSFWFDVKHNYVYVSFRDCNEVAKIAYPSGTVVAEYGGNCITPSAGEKELFCGQHSVSIGTNGALLLFNNNSCNPAIKPSAMVFKEVAAAKPRLEVAMKIPMPVNWPSEYNDLLSSPPGGGGNIIQLANNSLFISDCPPFSDVSIISNGNKVLWSAITETLNGDKWMPTGQYRASIIINKGQLEKLVWEHPKRGVLTPEKLTMN